MKLKIITVDTQLEKDGCDYITLSIADDKKGGFSGSYGIKKGHARAVFSLKEGKVTAQRQGEIVFSAETSSGFAVVEGDVVTITVDRAEEAESK